jgi:hypothetical protein
MNECRDEKAFNKFLKYYLVWHDYYNAFNSLNSRRWRDDQEYQTEERDFFDYEDPLSWIGSAFSWYENGGDEIWSALSRRWNDVYLDQNRKFYISCIMPRQIKTV